MKRLVCFSQKQSVAILLLVIFLQITVTQSQIVIDNEDPDFEEEILFPSNSTCDYDGCGTPPPNFIANDRICQVIAPHLPVDCSCKGNSTRPPFRSGCFECDKEGFTARQNYTTVQQAIDLCPYNPSIIEVIGTHFVNKLRFPPDRDVVLRGYLTRIGITECDEAGEKKIDKYKMENPDAVFDYLLNITVSRIPIVPDKPTVFIGSNFEMEGFETAISIINITTTGCGTDNPLFVLCGWEKNNTNTGVCDDAPDPLDDAEDLIMCEKNATHIMNCDSELGFPLNCTQFIKPPGPCIDEDGSFDDDCDEMILTPPFWNCTNHELYDNSTRWKCRWDKWAQGLIRCKRMGELVYPSASPHPSPDIGCEKCPDPPEEEFPYVDCTIPPRLNRTRLFACDDCLTNHNITIINSTFTNFRGPNFLKLYAFDENIHVIIEDSNFVDIPGTVLDIQGVHTWRINRNLFERTGGLNKEHVFLKANFLGGGTYELIRNAHYLNESTQESVCFYYFNGEVRCNEGRAECLNFPNTTLNDCTPVFRDSLNGVLFNQDCAVFEDCPCGTFNLTDRFNDTTFNETIDIPPDFDFEETDIIADGIVTRILFNLRGLLLPFFTNQLIFLPCAATNNTIPLNFTVPDSGNNTLVDSVRCPVPMNDTMNGNMTMGNMTLPFDCEEFIKCPCPRSPLDRANMICDFTIQDGLGCQNGFAVCTGNFSISNVTYSNETMMFIADAGFNTTFVNMTGDGDMGGASNATTGGLRCLGQEMTFCGCPALNVTRDMNGTIIMSEEIPMGEEIAEADMDGGSGNFTWAIETTYNFLAGNASLECVDGEIRCDCANSTISEDNICYDIHPCATSFHLDNIPDNARVVRIWDNLAEGLRIGLQLQRVGYDVIADNSFLVPRWFEETGKMHEIWRQNNNFTGTWHDMVDGYTECQNYMNATNYEECIEDADNVISDAEEQEEILSDCGLERIIPCKLFFCDDGCKIFVPREIEEACSVDLRFHEGTPEFGTLRFNKIQDAIGGTDGIDGCILSQPRSIVVHGSGGVYDEHITFDINDETFVFSLNNAILIRVNHGIDTDDLTIRGLWFINDQLDPFPVFRTIEPDEDLWPQYPPYPIDISGQQPSNFTIKNCLIDGNFAFNTGVLLGRFHGLTIRYNTVINCVVRAIDIAAGEEDDDGYVGYEDERLTIKWNTFINVEGTILRAREQFNYDVSCNKYISSRGFADADVMDIWLIETVDKEEIFSDYESTRDDNGANFLEDLFQNLGDIPVIPTCQPDDEDGTGEDADGIFDIFGAEDGLTQEGCALGMFPECWFVGNIQIVNTDSTDISDVCVHLVGGDMLPLHVRDNVCPKARFGLHFEYLTYISFEQRLEVHMLNPLTQVRIHQKDNFGADYLFRRIFSLVDRPASFPCVRDYEEYPLGELEVNKNFDIYNHHPIFHKKAYGFDKYNNITYAVSRAPFAYVGFLRTNSTIRVTAYNASRLSEERIYVGRAATVRGDPHPCGVYPAIYGCLHLVDTWYLNVSRIRFVLRDCDASGDPLWFTSSGPITHDQQLSFSITYNLMFNDTEFDGNHLINGRTTILDIRIAQPNGTFDLNRSYFFDWAIFPPGSKRLNTKRYLNGLQPDTPFEKCEALRAQILDEENNRELLDPGEGFIKVEILNEEYKKQCKFEDSEARCPTAPENTGRERKIPKYQRKCPGGNCQDYYLGAANNAAQGRPVEVVRYGPQGRLIRADMAPSTSAVYVQFGSNLVQSFETIIQRNEDDEAIDFDETLDDEFQGTNKFEIRRNLVSLGVFEPFVDDDDADDYVDHYFDDLVRLRTKQRADRNRNINDPSSITGSALARTRVETRANVVNNTFTDISGSTITVVDAWSARIDGNQAIDCGMYDPYAIHCMAMIGRRDSTGSYKFQNNYFNQRRSPLYPQTNAGNTAAAVSGAPIHYAAYRMSSMCDASEFEFRNNTSLVHTNINDPDGTITYTTDGRFDGRNLTGAMYGLRLSGMCTILFDNTIDQSNNFFPTYRPDQVPLRDLINKDNENLKGILCDITICELTSDLLTSTSSFRNDCVCCVNGCAVEAPSKCFVDRDNDTFVPQNPFFGRLLFTDIGTAMNLCEAPTRTIVVVPQDSPYTDLIIVNGPGDYLVESPDGAIVQTSRITINADNIIMKDLTFEHEGNMPTITTDTTVSNFTLLNSTFDGGDTYQPAIWGTFSNLTIQQVKFTDYDSDYLINVTASCSNFDFQNNTIEDVPGAAIYATQLNSYTVSKNYYFDSGNRVDGINGMVYLEACLDLIDGTWFVNSTGPMLFEENKSFQLDDSGIEDMPDCGYGTTFYINGLPPSNWDIRGNQASGHSVGMRILNFTNLVIDSKTVALPPIPQAFLMRLAIAKENIRVQGEVFDLAAMHQCDDEFIKDNDPQNKLGRFCNDGCPLAGGNAFVFGFFFIILFFIFLAAFFLKCLPLITHKRDTVRSDILNADIHPDIDVQREKNRIHGLYGKNGKPKIVSGLTLKLKSEEKAKAKEILEQHRAKQNQWNYETERNAIQYGKPDKVLREDN